MASSSPEGKVCGKRIWCDATIKPFSVLSVSLFIYFFVMRVGTLPELGVGFLQKHPGHLGRHALFEASH